MKKRSLVFLFLWIGFLLPHGWAEAFDLDSKWPKDPNHRVLSFSDTAAMSSCPGESLLFLGDGRVLVSDNRSWCQRTNHKVMSATYELRFPVALLKKLVHKILVEKSFFSITSQDIRKAVSHRVADGHARRLAISLVGVKHNVYTNNLSPRAYKRTPKVLDMLVIYKVLERLHQHVVRACRRGERACQRCLYRRTNKDNASLFDRKSWKKRCSRVGRQRDNARRYKKRGL